MTLGHGARCFGVKPHVDVQPHFLVRALERKYKQSQILPPRTTTIYNWLARQRKYLEIYFRKYSPGLAVVFGKWYMSR